MVQVNTAPSFVRSRGWATAHAIGLVALAFAVSFHVDLAQPVSDPFQEAEYAIMGPLILDGARFPTPVLIHGGLDVLPSRLAAAGCRAEAQLVCVRTINTGLQFVAGLLLFSVVAIVAGLGSGPALLASAPAAALLWLYGGATDAIADAHQATPGIRDVVVLAALLVMGRLATGLDEVPRRPRPVALFILGLLAAAAPFWAYNRGLVVVAAVGLFVLLLCAAGRSLRPALVATMGALAGTAVIAGMAGPSLFRTTLSDVAYWSRNGALWHAPIHLPTLLPALLFNVVAATVALPAGWFALKAGRPGRAVMTLVLLAIASLYTVQSLNRADLLHVRWILWPAAVLLGVGVAGLLEGMRTPRGGATAVVATLLAGLCLEGLSDHSIGGGIRYGLLRNARLLGGAVPPDLALADPDLVRVADLVRATGRCTFAANNTGLVHLLSGAPPCSRFLFGAYVAPDMQQAVIAELEAAKPLIILWDASAWWAHIDRRAMRERTPILADWIETNFGVLTRVGPYTLRSQSPLDKK